MTAPDIFQAITNYDLEELQKAIQIDPLSVDAKDGNGMPPLYTAARNRNAPAIEVLLNAGADLDIFACCYLERNVEGQCLLDASPGLVRSTTPDGRTPLHYAGEKGNTEIARTLIRHNADVNAVDHRGRTPLLAAAHGGPWKPAADQELIDLLLENGATVDLHTAAAIGRADQLKAVLAASTAGPDQHDESGYTALYHAAHNNHLECVRILIESGANVNLPCEDGQTALTSAALHLLSQQCDPEICRLLIANGAPFDIHTASALGDVEQISVLLEADPSLSGLLRYGFYPADYAVHCGRVDALRTLLDAGTNPNSRDEYGQSLLSKCGHLPELHQLLLSFGAVSE